MLEHTPRGLRRTFTLLEAADLLTRADLSGIQEIPAGGRAAAVACRMDAARAQRVSTAADDIADPIDGGASAHRAAAEAIASALRPLTDDLVGTEPAHRAGRHDDASIALTA